MNPKIGQYYYGPHYAWWGIWLKEKQWSATFVKDVRSRDEARREVYRLNGWGEPKPLSK
jgi:hypothetical protein